MERPKVGVGVFMVKDEKILLLKRKGSHGEGTWGLPGGHLEFRESLFDCAYREVFEETGVRISKAYFLTATNDVFDKENKHYITVFMKTYLDSQEPKNIEPEKCEKLEWSSWENLPQPLFLPIKNLLKQGFDLFQNDKIKKYQHYKGNYYELLHEGKHSETHEDLVVYKALYDSPRFGENSVWVRPKKMFTENVMVDGKEVPRFKFVEERQTQ